MILKTKAPAETLLPLPTQPHPSTSTSTSTAMGVEDLPPSYLPPSPSHTAPAGSIAATAPASVDLPLLLPPLYAPSPSSPFLVASSPSLDALVPRFAFLSLVKALNSSLQPTPFVRSARTAENVVNAVPVVGLVYGIGKWFFGGLGMGLVKESVRGVELLVGSKNLRATTAVGNAQHTLFGTSTAYIPEATRAIINQANSPDGLFPPHSSLLLALLPFSSLPSLLAQYDSLPRPFAAAHLVASANALTSSSSCLTPKQRKALKVRGRVDFQRWAWLSLEDGGLDHQLDDVDLRVEVGSPKGNEIIPRRTQSVDSLASSSGVGKGKGRESSGGGGFSHVDEKLSARKARRGRREGGVQEKGEEQEREEAGFDGGDKGKVGPDTLFLVVVRRGLEGMEGWEGTGAQ